MASLGSAILLSRQTVGNRVFPLLAQKMPHPPVPLSILQVCLVAKCGWAGQMQPSLQVVPGDVLRWNGRCKEKSKDKPLTTSICRSRRATHKAECTYPGVPLSLSTRLGWADMGGVA